MYAYVYPSTLEMQKAMAGESSAVSCSERKEERILSVSSLPRAAAGSTENYQTETAGCV